MQLNDLPRFLQFALIFCYGKNASTRHQVLSTQQPCKGKWYRKVQNWDRKSTAKMYKKLLQEQSIRVVSIKTNKYCNAFCWRNWTKTTEWLPQMKAKNAYFDIQTGVLFRRFVTRKTADIVTAKWVFSIKKLTFSQNLREWS